MAAHAALLKATPRGSPLETAVQVHIHDCLHPHHDKDFRCCRAFPFPQLTEVAVRIWRVSPQNQLKIDTLRGLRSDGTGKFVDLLIHKGHMQLLVPQGHAVLESTGSTLPCHNQQARPYWAVGWPALLDQQSSTPPAKPADAIPCRCCRLSSGTP